MEKGIQEQIESHNYNYYKPFNLKELNTYNLYVTILGYLHIYPNLETDYIKTLIKTNDEYNLTLALEIIKSQVDDK